MLDPTKFDAICRSAADVPPAALPFVRSEFVQALGEDVPAFLPALATAFPRAVAAMKAHWSKPVLVANQGVQRWVVDLALEQSDKNLFFDLGFEGSWSDGPEFDEAHQMLPARWRELYRKIDSFQIVDHSIPSIYWVNTPFGYSARFDLDDYCDFIGVKAAKGKALSRALDSDRLRAWLVTENRNALFIDEQRNDGRVYHVHGAEFDDYYVLSDPGETLDAYLTHVISGGLPGDFAFRAR